jgi:polar amino acid transport system substrate-binding protein
MIIASFCMAVPTEDVVVGYSAFRPMIFQETNQLEGFDVELMNMIGEDNNWNISYKKLSNPERFDFEKQGANLLIGGVSLTEDREKLFDFSTPYMNSGLLIGARTEETPSVISMILINSGIWKSIGFLLIVIIIAAHLVWLCEKGKDNPEESGNIDDPYFPGIFVAMWYVWITITTIGYGDYVARRWTGRIGVFVLTLIGLGIAANVVGEVSSFKMQLSLPKTQSISDLEGKSIGIVKGTTSGEVKSFLNAQYIECDESDDLLELFDAKKLDAIIFDAPFVFNAVKDRKNMMLVGDIFYKQDYGIVTPQGSPLREKISLSILKLQKSGKLDSLKLKWFGKI